MVQEMELVFRVLNKYNVKVYRPENISNYNQIFSRDIAFVIEDKMIISNILPDEIKKSMPLNMYGLRLIKIISLFYQKKLILKEEMLCHGVTYIFVGTYRGKDYADYITARTNMTAVSVYKIYFQLKK